MCDLHKRLTYRSAAACSVNRRTFPLGRTTKNPARGTNALMPSLDITFASFFSSAFVMPPAYHKHKRVSQRPQGFSVLCRETRSRICEAAREMRAERVLLYYCRMERIKLTKKFAVYVDYTGEIVPRPFYVGKGTEWRVNDRRSRNVLYRNIREKHGGMQRTIVFETDNEAEAYVKETAFVMFHRTYARGGESWWGANGDLGGKGGPSCPKSAEHREKIQRSLRDVSKSSAHCQAMSASAKMKEFTAVHRANIGIGSARYAATSEGYEVRRRAAVTANTNRWAAYRFRRAAHRWFTQSPRSAPKN